MKKILSILFLLNIVLIGCSKDNSIAVNYSNFKITEVSISKIPFTDKNGVGWDTSDGPDVFYNMEDEKNNILANGESSRYSDVKLASLPLTWTYSQAYPITNLDFTHYVTIYDYDSLSANDRIGYVGFTMSEHKSGYPTTITKSFESVTVTIKGVWY